MVLTDPWALPGGCLVVMGRKMNIFVSLKKGVLGPLVPRGGFAGILPHSRAKLVLLYNALFLLNTIHREGTGYAGACHQHVYLIVSSTNVI